MASSPSVERVVRELLFSILERVAHGAEAAGSKWPRSVRGFVSQPIIGPFCSLVCGCELPTGHAVDDLYVLDWKDNLEILVGSVVWIEHRARSPVLVRRQDHDGLLGVESRSPLL